MAFSFVCLIHGHLWATTLAQPTPQSPRWGDRLCWSPQRCQAPWCPRNPKQCLDVSYGKLRGSQTSLRSIWEAGCIPNRGHVAKGCPQRRLEGHGAWSPGITPALRREGFTSCWMGHHFLASFELPSPVNKAKAPSLQNTAVGSLAEESLLLEVFTAIEFFPSLRGVQCMATKPRKCKHSGHLTGHKPRSFTNAPLSLLCGSTSLSKIPVSQHLNWPLWC